MAIDSHMHVNHLVLMDPLSTIEKVNQDPLLESVINVGLQLESSFEAVQIAQGNSKFFAAVGVHPLYINNPDLCQLYPLAENKKVVAIGEIGLDDTNSNYQEQIDCFTRQIIIANELHLPVIIHSNHTNKEIIHLFKTVVKPRYGCVFHCFYPDLEDMYYLTNQGYYISFAGKITYKNAKKSLVVARQVPDDFYLVETDSPYLAPEPFRGEENHSSNISYIIHRLAEVKEKSDEEIETQTVQNTKTLFKKMVYR